MALTREPKSRGRRSGSKAKAPSRKRPAKRSTSRPGTDEFVEALQDTKDVYARLKALDPALAKRLKNDCKVIYEELKDVVPGEPAFFVPWL